MLHKRIRYALGEQVPGTSEKIGKIFMGRAMDRDMKRFWSHDGPYIGFYKATNDLDFVDVYDSETDLCYERKLVEVNTPPITLKTDADGMPLGMFLNAYYVHAAWHHPLPGLNEKYSVKLKEKPVVIKAIFGETVCYSDCLLESKFGHYFEIV